MEVKARIYGAPRVIGRYMGGPLIGHGEVLDEGVLTDEHAAASYGLPVYVGSDGVPRSPTETYGKIALVPVHHTYAQDEAVREWARRAGWKL